MYGSPRLVVLATEGRPDGRKDPPRTVACLSTRSRMEMFCRVFGRRPLLSCLGARTQVDPTVFHMLNEDPGGISFSEIGGLGEQIRELREVIELPLTNPELFIRVGIKPPKVNTIHTLFFCFKLVGRGRGVFPWLGLPRGCIRAHAVANNRIVDFSI